MPVRLLMVNDWLIVLTQRGHHYRGQMPVNSMSFKADDARSIRRMSAPVTIAAFCL